MRTIKLNISRDKSFVGAAMAYRVYVNNQEVDKIKVGKSISLDIPDAPATIKVSMVGNAVTIHPIEKEKVIFPEKSVTGIIDCMITTKPNWLGIFTSGLFQAIGKTDLIISYN